MRIGLDLDNTIACLDHLFGQIATGLRLGDFNDLSKKEVKSSLIELAGSEELWKRVQGQAYGAQYHNAKPFDAAVTTIQSWSNTSEINVFIVSHKTKYGHYDAAKINLQEVALAWLETNKICNPTAIPRENIYFEETLKAKISRITQLELDIFVDDLTEVLHHKTFPLRTRGILFSATGSRNTPVDSVVENWEQLNRLVNRDQ